MKKIAHLFVAVVMLLNVCVFAVYANDEISVVLNGEKLAFDVPPQIINGRTMVPMRAIFEALGVIVEWDGETRTARGVKQGIIVNFTIDSNVMYKNYCEIALDTPAQLVDGRTLLPVRAVSESFGVDVQWDGETRTVLLQDKDILKKIQINDTCYFVGEVAEGKPSGYGTLFENGEDVCIEIGLWEGLVLKKGYAIREYSNGDKMSGYIVNNKSEGYGEYYWEDGTYYKGNHLNDMRHGYGEYYLPDGSYYKGEYSNDIMHGQGVRYDAKRNVIEEGRFENGEFIGDTSDVMHNNGQGSGASSIQTRFMTAKYPLYLYSNDGKVFLGKLTLNEYDKDSIFNELGSYGSELAKNSIWNELGTYGSELSKESAFNELASSPPIIVDSNNKIIGYLTANELKIDGVSIVELMQLLKEYEH